MATADERNAERLARKKEREGKDRMIKIGLALVGILVIAFVATRPAVVLDEEGAAERQALSEDIERMQGLLETETNAETREELEKQLAKSRAELEALGDE